MEDHLAQCPDCRALESRLAAIHSAFPELEEELKRKAQPGDIILTVGAGDVYKIGENIVE